MSTDMPYLHKSIWYPVHGYPDQNNVLCLVCIIGKESIPISFHWLDLMIFILVCIRTEQNINSLSTSWKYLPADQTKAFPSWTTKISLRSETSTSPCSLIRWWKDMNFSVFHLLYQYYTRQASLLKLLMTQRRPGKQYCPVAWTISPYSYLWLLNVFCLYLPKSWGFG